jgi:ubiquinone/menaquinone biosynthesis C-methylase UbiE
MTGDAARIEGIRLAGVEKIEDYPSFRERHRAFPAVFEDRDHKLILDVAAGVGASARRIHDQYSGHIICNDITPNCLKILQSQGLETTSFDIDNDSTSFPFPDGFLDAVMALATIEHVIYLDHFVQEIYRLIKPGGYFYVSAPNYAGLAYLSRYVRGVSFHSPLIADQRYEFYAHVRYFTYQTLLEFITSFGFCPEAVYLPLPEGSSHYQALYSRSRAKALTFRYGMKFLYKFFSPRWASEPILCFQKTDPIPGRKPRKVLL